jgi:hypothetical protein
MALLRLTPQVEQIYQEKSTIPSTEQHIFQKSKEELLELPTFALENWIFKAKIRIKASKKRESQKRRVTKPHPFFLRHQTKHKINHDCRKTTHKTKTSRKEIKRIATTITKFFTYKNKTQIHTLQTNNDLFPP